MKNLNLYVSIPLLTMLSLIACNDLEEIEMKSTFIHYYSEGTAVDILKTDDGGFLMAGTDGDGSFIIKTTGLGNREWNHEIESFHVKDILLNPSNNEEFILLGDFEYAGPDDIIIKYYSEAGEITSVKPSLIMVGQNRGVNDLKATMMAINPGDGQLVIAGESPDSNGLTRPFIFKLNADASLEWVYELGQDDQDAEVTLSQSMLMEKGGLTLMYNVTPLDGNATFIRMVSLQMQTGIENTLNVISDERDLFVSEWIPTSFGYAFTGYGSSFLSNQELRLTIILSNGQVIKSSTDISSSTGNSIAYTSDGGFLIGGNSKVVVNNNNFLLVKTDQSGELSWDEEKIFGGEANELICKVLEVDDGYILYGTYFLPIPRSNLSRVTLLKTNKKGRLYE